MVVGPDVTRRLRPGEEAEVDALLRAAFPGPDEAALVQRLRDQGAMAWEFVQPWKGRIGGYAAISRMVAPEGWYCLAPVAVWPEWQGGALGQSFHFGTRLVSAIADQFNDPHGLEPEARTLVVLGKPSFYARCGFSLERAARLHSPWPVDHTLIARPGDDVPEETLVYPAAFDGL